MYVCVCVWFKFHRVSEDGIEEFFTTFLFGAARWYDEKFETIDKKEIMDNVWSHRGRDKR